VSEIKFDALQRRWQKQTACSQFAFEKQRGGDLANQQFILCEPLETRRSAVVSSCYPISKRAGRTKELGGKRVSELIEGFRQLPEFALRLASDPKMWPNEQGQH
jgi:hypothetical protein